MIPWAQKDNGVSQEIVFQGDSMVGKLNTAPAMTAFRDLHGNVEVCMLMFAPMLNTHCHLCCRFVMVRSLRWTRRTLNGDCARVSTCGHGSTMTLSPRHGLVGLSSYCGEFAPNVAMNNALELIAMTLCA